MVKKIAILGAGESGIGAAILAEKKGLDCFVSDAGKITNENKKTLLINKIQWEEGGHSISKILTYDEVIKSPGIADSSNIISIIDRKGIPIISEVEFAFHFTKARIIAITGSNGKTTTTKLIAQILEDAGFDVLVAGNIGFGFSRGIAERDYDYIVLEISSFQLDRISRFKPDIAIILNITPDHLKRYNNDFDRYATSKLRITMNQDSSNILIYNDDDEVIKKKLKTKARKIPFTLKNSLECEGAFYNQDGININLNNKNMTIQELALQGKHNLYNSMAAAIAARVLDVKNDIIRQSMLDFQNIEHRLEYVLTVHGIDFINDSKATNVNASWFALESMKKDVVWIVGGVDKGNDYSELVQLVEEKVNTIICLGDKNQKIIKFFQGKVDTIVQASSMIEAVNQSFSIADKGGVVLLSPACASFDLFENYEDRGVQFKQAVRSL